MANIAADAVPSLSGASSNISLSDPYKIAYLRGGVREMLRLKLFELMQMGYLIVAEKKRWIGKGQWLTVAPDAPSRDNLSDTDKALLASFEIPKSAQEVASLNFPSEMESDCRSYRQDLLQRGLLKGWLAPESKAFHGINYAVLAVFIVAFFSIPIATNTGPAAAISIMIAYAIANWHLKNRLAYNASDTGRDHLRALKEQYASFAKRDRAQWELAPPMSQLTAVAVLGYGILQGGPADAFADLLGAHAHGGVEYGVEVGGGCGACDAGCG